MISKLALQIYEDGDCNTFTVKDISLYNTDITVSCERLSITPPGFGDTYELDVTKGFHNAYTSYDLSDNCDDNQVELQDGIYQVRYDICPTDKVFVEYNHLRQCKALNKYHEGLCALKLESCSPSTKQKEKIEQLKDIKLYLDAAKAYVETCNAPKKGLELHNYAVEKLNKLNLTCRNCK